MLYGYKENHLNIYIQLVFFFVLDVTKNVTFMAPARQLRDQAGQRGLHLVRHGSNKELEFEAGCF